jgi:hypothetical protein
VESSCEFGIEPSGSMKCWETIEWPNICGLSDSAQLHIVSLVSYMLQVTCFGPRWPSSGGIYNYFRKVTSLQLIRCFCVIGFILYMIWQIPPSSI